MTTSTSRMKSTAISVPLMSVSNIVLQPPTEVPTRNSNLTNSFKIENDATTNEMELRSGSRHRMAVSRKASSNPRLGASDVSLASILPSQLAIQDSERSSKRQRTEAHRRYKTPTRVLSTNDFLVVMNEVLNSSEKFCLLNEEEMRTQSEQSTDSRSVLWKKLQDLNQHLRLSDLKIIFQTIPLHLCSQFVRFLSPLVKESETLLTNAKSEVSMNNRWTLLCGLESIEIILRFLSSTDAPLQFQLDSIIESTIHTIGVQLQQILAYQLSRLTNEVKFALDVQFMNSMETILRLVESFLQAVPLDSSILVPFVRVLLQILELELPDYLVFIRNVVVLLVSISQRNQDLQMMIFEELLSIMMSQASTDSDQDSSFQISGQEQDSIQTTAALLLLMIQASVGLPEIDSSSSSSSPKHCLGPAYRLAEDFWNTIFAKLALLKTDKSDGTNDCKQLIEKLIKDLLCVLLVPEFPAANLMLISFVKIVISEGKGLDHSNLFVRMVSLNLLGTISLKLCKLSIQQQEEPLNLQNLTTKQNFDQWGVEDSNEIALIKMAILDHLGRLDPMNDLIWKHGHCFLSCSLWDDRQWKLSSSTQSKHNDHELQQLLIHHIHYINTTLERKNPTKASSVDAQQLVRSLLFAQGLGQLKELIIKAIASTGNRNHKNAQHNANLRARSMKCLNALIELDSFILCQEGVKQGVHNALLDSAISVRESALELIGRYIGKSEDLIMQYYYLLIRASQDPGVSVKKRALKLLFEICAQNPAFPRRTETLLVILLCIQDREEQIQISVCKAFFQLWFTGTNIQSSVRDFCSILAFARTQSSHYILHLPSVTFWQLILNQNKTLSLEVGQKMTVELFRSLLEDGSDQELNPVFMALHVLSTANVHFLVPEDEPCRYIFILHPHLVENNNPASNQEQLFILLELFHSLLTQVCHHLKKDQLTELRIIFYDLMTKHSTRRVLTAACRCLCTLANGTPTIEGFVLRLLENYRMHLTDNLVRRRDQEMDPSSHRLFFLIGQICQNCAELLEQNSNLGLKPYLELFMDLFSSSNHGKLKESALEGVCMMLSVRSKFLRDFRKVDGILKQAICQRQDPSLQKTALRSLTILFKTEEEAMIQHRTNQCFSNSGLNNNCNLSSGIIQNLWSEICSCSLEVNQERDRGSSIRNLALELINVILEGGLIAPWLSVPYLIALTTDPTPSTSSKSLSILKSVKEKQNALFIKETLSGLSPSYVFHSSLEDISPEGVCLPVIKGFGCCYQNLVQSSPADCRKVLNGLLRPFDMAANLTSMEQEAPEFRFLLFSAQTITRLKFRTLEEVLCLIHGAQNIISLRSESVLSKLKEQSEQPMNHDNIKLSTAAATLILLVNFRNNFKKVYSIRQSRIEEFDPRQNRKFQEEKGQVLPKKKCQFEVKLSDYEIKTEPIKLQDQYFQLESLVIDVGSSEDGGDSEEEWMPQSRTPTSSTASDEGQYRMKLRNRK